MQKAFLVSAIVVLLAVPVTVATVFSPTQSHAQGAKTANAATVHAGQEIFAQKCLLCHSINKGQVTFGPSLYAEMKKPQGKKSSAEVRSVIKNGKGKMPSFQEKLSAEDVDKLLAYIRTL
jgi:mono/diheme cytochrome c family protein